MMFAFQPAGAAVIPSGLTMEQKQFVGGMALSWEQTSPKMNGVTLQKTEIPSIPVTHSDQIAVETWPKVEGSVVLTALSGTSSDVANGGQNSQPAVAVKSVESSPKLKQESKSSGSNSSAPKRLHVSNIPFRYREMELKNLLQEFGQILDVEIIFNERGSKGFGFVTFANSADAEKARLKMNGALVEGRKIEVNNATQRIVSKKHNHVHLNGCDGPPVKMIMMSPQMPVAALPANSLAQAAQFQLPVSAQRPGTIQLPAAPTNAGVNYNGAAVYPAPYLAAYTDRLQSFPLVYPSNTSAQFGIQAAAVPGAVPTVPTAVPTVATLPATVAAFNANAGAAILSQFCSDSAAVGSPYASHSIGPIAAIGPVIYRSQRFTPY